MRVFLASILKCNKAFLTYKCWLSMSIISDGRRGKISHHTWQINFIKKHSIRSLRLFHLPRLLSLIASVKTEKKTLINISDKQWWNDRAYLNSESAGSSVVMLCLCAKLGHCLTCRDLLSKKEQVCTLKLVQCCTMTIRLRLQFGWICAENSYHEFSVNI